MNRVTKWVAAAIAAAAPVSVAAAAITYGGRLPHPLPTHWNLQGQVDGTTAPEPFLGACLVLASIFAELALVSVVRSDERTRHDALAACATWAAWQVSAVALTSVLVSVDAPRAEAAELHPSAVLAIVVLPTVLAALVWRLLPSGVAARRTVEPPASPLELSPTERITWVGQARSPRLLATAGVVMLIGVLLLAVAWEAAVVAFLVGVVMAWVHAITVRVDDGGLRAWWGPIRLPGVVVPLEHVEAARVQHIDPLEWGGWGYRITPRGRALVARGGPGMVIERSGRPPLAVTVDGSDVAVDVLNALVARRRTVAGPPTGGAPTG